MANSASPMQSNTGACMKNRTRDYTLKMHPGCDGNRQTAQRRDEGMLKSQLAQLEKDLIWKINSFLFFGEGEHMAAPVQSMSFQQAMVLLSHNLYIYDEIDVSSSGVDDQQIAMLMKHVKGCATPNDLSLTRKSKIHSLYLGYNSISAGGQRAIADFLGHHENNIELLSLCSNDIEHGIEIAKSLQNNARLKELNLHSNHISDHGLMEISRSLQSNTTLTFLDVDCNRIHDESVLALADCLLNYNSSLTSLSLADNLIGEDGGIALGKVISKNSTLRYLNVSRNRLGNRGVAAILLGMETNKTVSRLELSSNDFDDGAAIGIADMLDLNSTVKHLKVDHNDMTDFGAERISKILMFRAKNLQLKTLSCSYNNFTDAGIALLKNFKNCYNCPITICTFGNGTESSASKAR